MKESAQILRGKNIRVTPQRLGVYKIFSAGQHLTADDIFTRIKNRFPAISLATVYTILELFKKKNIIQELRIKFDKSCYALWTTEHHHFFCKNCEKIFDVVVPLCRTLKERAVNGHHIEDFQGYFYGTCAGCRKGK